MYLGPETIRERESFDYLDYPMDLSFPGVPRRFNGVSGGGVRRVMVFYSRETDEIDWKMSLHGVAFYQLEIANEQRPVRCHGPQSVRAVLRELNAPAHR
jgi:hypothetical protein